MIEIGHNLQHAIEYGILTFGTVGIVRAVLNWSVKFMDYLNK
ncbi:hypothetical protein [Leuconostoc citreum]